MSPLVAPKPILHSVTRTTEWSAPARPVADLFTRVYPVVGPMHYTCKFHQMADPRLRKMLCNLSFLAGREIATREKNHLYLLFGLLHAFRVECRPDLHMLHHVPFIGARSQYSSTAEGSTKLSSTAVMILTYVHHPMPPPNPDFPNPLPEEVEFTDRDLCIDYKDASTDFIEGLIEATQPLDAQITRQRRGFVLLPLLCVANPFEIFSALTSMLYQRYVWGINAPVVGMGFDERHAAGRIFIGWLAPPPSPGYLPQVHFATATSADADCSLGLFDLKKPSSIAQLGQFLCDLESSFSDVITRARSGSSLVGHGFCWRADHRCLNPGERGCYTDNPFMPVPPLQCLVPPEELAAAFAELNATPSPLSTLPQIAHRPFNSLSASAPLTSSFGDSDHESGSKKRWPSSLDYNSVEHLLGIYSTPDLRKMSPKFILDHFLDECRKGEGQYSHEPMFL